VSLDILFLLLWLLLSSAAQLHYGCRRSLAQPILVVFAVLAMILYVGSLVMQFRQLLSHYPTVPVSRLLLLYGSACGPAAI
jgi:hypothetical protein